MNTATYWDDRYERGYTSGDGSYGNELDRRIAILSTIEYPQTIVDVGCGDFNFGSHLHMQFREAKYLGLDISDYIVRRNASRFPQAAFQLWDGADFIPHAELVLCLDVLFHIEDDAKAAKVLRNLDNAWTKYLALTAYEYDGLKRGHVFIRRFDWKEFGAPIFREVVEEDGQKYFYLFKR